MQEMKSISFNRILYLLLFEGLLMILFFTYGYLPLVVVLSAAFLIGLIVYSFDYPLLLLYVFIFSILVGSLGIFKVTGSGKAPPILIVDLLFPIVISILLVLLLISKEKFELPSFIFFWLPFVIWGLLSFIVSVDKLRALLIWRNYFAGLITFTFAFLIIKNKFELEKLIFAVILWAAILSVIEFYIIYNLGGFSVGIIGVFFRKNLIATSWGKSNYLATFYVIILPITLGYFLYTNSKKKKIFSIFSAVVIVTALILTLSRGGILSLLVAVIFFLSQIVKPKNFISIVISILALGIIIFLNPLTSVLIDRMLTFERSFSYMTRINFYEDVWKMFLDNPVFGVGLGNLGYHSKFIISTHASAHNILLGLLGETGIIGALLFIALIGRIIYDLFMQYRNEEIEKLRILRWAFLSSLFGGLVHSMMEPNFEGFQFSIIYWLIVALSYKLYLLKTSLNRPN